MQSLSSVESTTFSNVTTRFRSIDSSNSGPSGWSDGSKNTVVYDVDGSISGLSYYYCLPHEFGYYQGPGCVVNSLFDMCCPQAYLTSEVLCLDREAFGDYSATDAAGQPACPPVNIMHQTRLDVQGVDFSVNVSASLVYDLPMNNGNEQWNTLWAVNSSYLISFDQYSPSWTGFQIANTYAGDWVEFAYCLPTNAVLRNVSRGRALAAYGVSPTWAIYSQYSPIVAIPTFAAFQALGPTIEWPNAGGYYYWDQQRNIVHLHVQSRSFRQWGSGDVNSDYCGLDGCDFLVVHTTGDNTGVSDCPARAFNKNSNDGSLQVTSGSVFFSAVPIGPRINGPVQHVAPGRALYIDAGADSFYAQNNAPTEGDPYFTDDRGLTWIGDDQYQRSATSSIGYSGGFDHRVTGDIYNLAFMYQSVATGGWEYLVNVTTLDTYVLSLYFMEVYWPAAGQRLFNIFINGQAVYNNVDIFALSGGQSTALQLHCFVNLTTAASTPIITIVSQQVKDNPIISGFTIIPYSIFVDTFPGESIDAGTAAVAPTIAAAPPVNNGGGGGGGGGAPVTPALPVPAGWVWISPANTTYVTGGSISTVNGVTVNTNSPEGVALNSWESAQPQLFETNRYGTFSYAIPVPTAGTWQLRLLFAETYWATQKTRTFSVQINGVTPALLNNLDLNTVGPDPTQPATTGPSAGLTSTTALVYAQTLTVGSGAIVNINFVRNDDNPLVCGVLLVPIADGTTAAPVPSSTAATNGQATSAPVAPTSAAVAPTSAHAAPTSAPVAATSSSVVSAKSPTYSLLIDAGSNVAYSQDASHLWQADEYFNIVGLTWQGQDNQAYANTAASLYTVYNSNRYSASTVNYTLPVPTAGTYQLRLMFAEIYWTTVGQRLFDVEVQGAVLIPQLDIFAAAGGVFTAYDVYTNVTITGQQRSVQVVLRSLKDNALLSGIQLLSWF